MKINDGGDEGTSGDTIGESDSSVRDEGTSGDTIEKSDSSGREP